MNKGDRDSGVERKTPEVICYSDRKLTHIVIRVFVTSFSSAYPAFQNFLF
jgi:hypothetical protein